MGSNWNRSSRQRYSARHAVPITRGVLAFLRSAYRVWYRGY